MAGKVKVTVKGGEKIKAFLKTVENKIKAPTLRVGWLEDATYPDGKSVAMVASFQEFGTPNARWPIPPRPMMRPMFEAGKTTWPRQLGKLLTANNYDGVAALDAMGDVIIGQLQNRVIRTNSPALSPVTVMMRSLRRKYPQSRVGIGMVYRAIRMVQAGDQLPAPVQTNPLTDTKHMLMSISKEVTTRFNRGGR